MRKLLAGLVMSLAILGAGATIASAHDQPRSMPYDIVPPEDDGGYDGEERCRCHEGHWEARFVEHRAWVQVDCGFGYWTYQYETVWVWVQE